MNPSQNMNAAEEMKRGFTDLPTEILAMIAEHGANRSEKNPIRWDAWNSLTALSSLSRTCRRLRDICEPILYQRLSFLEDNIALIHFATTLLSRPDLGYFVRVLRMPQPTWHLKHQNAEAAKSLTMSDPTACKVLSTLPNGDEEETLKTLANLLMVMILRHLPRLTCLLTHPSALISAQYWPEKQRLDGSSISTLHLADSDAGLDGRPSCDWSKVFQPGKAPARLLTLCLPLSVVHISCRSTFSTVRELILQYNNTHGELDRLDEVPLILSYFPSVVHLRLVWDSFVLDDALVAIATTPGFAERLERLEVWLTSVDSVDNEAEDPYMSLRHFPQLKSLKIPMLDFPSGASTIALPAGLEDLTLSWERLPKLGFLRVMAGAIESMLLAPDLKTITLQWDTFVLSEGIHAWSMSSAEIWALAEAIKNLESVCESQKITLLNREGAWPEEDPHSCDTLDEIIYREILADGPNETSGADEFG